MHIVQINPIVHQKIIFQPILHKIKRLKILGFTLKMLKYWNPREMLLKYWCNGVLKSCKDKILQKKKNQEFWRTFEYEKWIFRWRERKFWGFCKLLLKKHIAGAFKNLKVLIFFHEYLYFYESIDIFLNGIDTKMQFRFPSAKKLQKRNF